MKRKSSLSLSFILFNAMAQGRRVTGVVTKEGSTEAIAGITVSVEGNRTVETYNMVLKSAGASFVRDTLDERIINEVRNRTGRIIDVQGGFVHGTPYAQA